MLGMFAEIPLILVVYTEMKQTEKYFITKKNYLGCRKVTKEIITCIHANVQGFLDFNILPKAIQLLK